MCGEMLTTRREESASIEATKAEGTTKLFAGHQLRDDPNVPAGVYKRNGNSDDGGEAIIVSGKGIFRTAIYMNPVEDRIENLRGLGGTWGRVHGDINLSFGEDGDTSVKFDLYDMPEADDEAESETTTFTTEQLVSLAEGVENGVYKHASHNTRVLVVGHWDARVALYQESNGKIEKLVSASGPWIYQEGVEVPRVA